MRLEDEVHVRPELNALAGRERQQPVIVEHGVEIFGPLWIDVPVEDDPISFFLNIYSEIIPMEIYT